MKVLLTTAVFFGILNKMNHADLGVNEWEETTMADNKQYITQIQDNGAVMISEDVIASIVSLAVKDVEGVVNINSKPAAELADIIGKKWGKGVKITIGEDNAVNISVNVLVGYGQSVVAVAEMVQTSVITSVQSMTGVQNVTVDVNVCGIVRV